MRTRTIRSLIYFAAGLGLIVAIFAAAEFFDTALTAVCSFSAFFSCGAVDGSGKTTTLGIQDWIWGIVGFLAILVVATLAEQNRRDIRWAYALLAVTSAGVALAMYLLYVELVEIGALCPVCVTAYSLGIVAWVGAILLVRKMAVRARTRAARTAAEAAA
jgi:uncharacterized membrane protein